MTITLPDSLRPWLEAEAQRLGLRIDDLVAQLLLRQQASGPEGEWLEELLLETFGREPKLRERERAERHLEALIQQGLVSGPAVAVTPEFWEQRRQVLRQRIAEEDRKFWDEVNAGYAALRANPPTEAEIEAERKLWENP